MPVRAAPIRQARDPEGDSGATASATPVTSATAPVSRLRGEAGARARSVQAMDPRAASTPPAAPAPSIAGETSTVSRVVPTASTHHVRRPSMMSSAYSNAPTTPSALPATDRMPASLRNTRRMACAGNPVARSSPSSRSRCSTPRRKKRLANSSADTTRKKLK